MWEGPGPMSRPRDASVPGRAPAAASTVEAMRTRAIVLVAVLAAVVAVGVAAFLRSDDESSSSTTTPEAPEPVACDTLPGRPVDEVLEGGSCLGDDGRIVVLVWTERTCSDGRVVVWADQGWGFRGDVWQVHARPDGQRVPPDEVLALCPS
jgi:hypothetical protein